MPTRSRHRLWRALLVVTGASVVGCSPADLVGTGELPPGTSDPRETQTHEGALRAYATGLIRFRVGVAGLQPSAVFLGGVLTDELAITDPVSFSYSVDNPSVDRRLLAEFSDPAVEEINFPYYSTYRYAYKSLQRSRAGARVGAWLLDNFAPTESPALAAHLRAVEGYTDIYLADMFCSGIPLSTVDPEGYTLAPGSSTAEVYQRAVALFDTALAAAGDSARILNFASIGKGRALLGLGQYAQAAQAVSAVPDGYEYRLQFDTTSNVDINGGYSAGDAASFMALLLQPYPTGWGMLNREGRNGLDWLTSGDPRSDATAFTGNYGPVYLPSKLDANGGGSLAIADWREARLIEAESQLQGGNNAGFLNTLNALRQGVVYPPAPGDTTGSSRTLAPLADPGTFDGRVDLLFRERAFWLFFTGHRQGDLRRLIRQYGRDQATVFPTGRHPALGGAYGGDVTFPIPALERRYNPLFTGCQNRGA